MQFSIQINNKTEHIAKQNAMDILAYGKQDSIDKRTPWQKFTDFIGALFVTTDEQKIGNLHDTVRISKQGGKQRTGADFMVEVAKFSQTLTNQGERADFLNGIRLQIKQHDDKSADVTFYDSSNPADRRTIHFADGFVLPNQLFELESDSTFKLKTGAHDGKLLEVHRNLLTLISEDHRNEAITICNDLPKSPTSKDFQGNILKIEKLVAKDKREEFRQQLRLEVTQQNETSVVNISLNSSDVSPFPRVGFKGEFKPHDRLFDYCEGSVFQLKPDTPGNRHIRNLYIKSLDMNAIWVNYEPAIKKILLAEANQPPEDLLQTRKDMGRLDVLYPEKCEDKNVWTQETFRTFFQTYFKPDITKFSVSFQRLYQQYAALGSEDRRALHLAVNGDKKEKQIPLDSKLVAIKKQFDQLGTSEQEKMQECFLFIYCNQFSGTDEEFLAALNNKEIPFVNKLITLVAGHQGFKSMIRVAYPEIAMGLDAKNNQDAFLQPFTPDVKAQSKTLYHYKPVSVDEKTQSVDIELQYHVDYEPCGNERREKRLPVVAHEVVTSQYTVSLPKGGELSDAKFTHHEDKLKYSLVVMDQAGCAPKDCDNMFIDEVEVTKPAEMSMTAQLQRRRVESKIQAQPDQGNFYSPSPYFFAAAMLV